MEVVTPAVVAANIDNPPSDHFFAENPDTLFVERMPFSDRVAFLEDGQPFVKGHVSVHSTTLALPPREHNRTGATW